MEVGKMDVDQLIRDMNGMGSRLNHFESVQGRHDERIKSNEANVSDLWTITKDIQNDIKKINETIRDAVLKVVVMVALPTLLVLYQLINSVPKA